jgi:hypothetical protein
MMDMMKKAQEMQAKVNELQEELRNTEIVGSAGGDMVEITLTGKGEMRGVKIDASLVSDGDVEIIEDLILAAHNDAKQKVETISAEKMAEVTSGLPIPPGMKLPF